MSRAGVPGCLLGEDGGQPRAVQRALLGGGQVVVLACDQPLREQPAAGASKRSLLMDAIRYGYWRLPPKFETRDAATALSLVLRRYVLADRKRRTWWQFWLAVTSYAQTDAEVRAELGRQHTSIIERWRYCLDRGIVDGVFEPGLDTQAHAQRLTAYAHGLAVSQLIDPVRRRGRRRSWGTRWMCSVPTRRRWAGTDPVSCMVPIG